LQREDEQNAVDQDGDNKEIMRPRPEILHEI
jgi:hypothetical protein